MIKPMYIILILNGFTGVGVIYTYVSALLAKQSTQNEQIEYLCQKIYKLEKQLNELQANNNLHDKMNDELQTKIKEFTQCIVTQYEIIE